MSLLRRRRGLIAAATAAFVNTNLALLALDSGSNNTSPNVITPSGVSALTGVTGGSWGTPGTQDAVFTRGADGTMYAVCLTGLTNGTPPAATSIWKSDATQVGGWTQVSTYTNKVLTEKTLAQALAAGTYLFVHKDALYEFAFTFSTATWTPTSLKKSTDGGQNWTTLTTPGAVTLASGLVKFYVKPSGTIVWGCSLAATFGTWIVSIDGGSSFNTLSGPTTGQAQLDIDYDGTNYVALTIVPGTGAMHVWQGTAVNAVNNDRQTITINSGTTPGSWGPALLTARSGGSWWMTMLPTSSNTWKIYTSTNVATSNPFTSQLDLGSSTVQPAQVYLLSDAKNYLYYNGALYSDRSGSWASYVSSLSNNFGPMAKF